MKIPGSCSKCKEALFTPGGPPARKPHCDSPNCDWCLSCFAAKQVECREAEAVPEDPAP